MSAGGKLRRPLVAVLAGLTGLLGLAACASNPHIAVPSEAPNTATTRPEASSTTVPTRTLHFMVTSADGWTYSGRYSIPDASFKLKLDIASSPPGEAQLDFVLDAGRVQEEDYNDTNPGRPNGPQFVLKPGWLAWSSAGLGDDYNGPSFDGACSYADGGPFVNGLGCGLSNGSNSGTTNSVGSESGAMAMINVINNQQPTYVLDLEYGNNGCEVYIAPDNTVTEAPAFDANCDYKFSGRVVG